MKKYSRKHHVVFQLHILTQQERILVLLQDILMLKLTVFDLLCKKKRTKFYDILWKILGRLPGYGTFIDQNAGTLWIEFASNKINFAPR